MLEVDVVDNNIVLTFTIVIYVFVGDVVVVLVIIAYIFILFTLLMLAVVAMVVMVMMLIYQYIDLMLNCCFISTRSYAALRAADLDWIVEPG